ncbi:MAG TPA: magnesium transporter [Nocardioides sp.]|nr:magnesium transporter [Nocardioides sp.]
MTQPTALPAPSEPLFPGSIDTYLITEVPLCSPSTTVAELQRLLVGGRFDSVADIAVVDPGEAGAESLPPRHRLLGLIRVETVLGADPSARAVDLMDPDPPAVAPGTDQEAAAWKAARHGESSLAVVDSAGGFRGLVTPQRLLTVLLTEHDQDLARLGGFMSSSASARHAMDEPLAARLWHRLPWLLLGLLGSAGAAMLVRGFEEDLAADVRLAFFIPGIVYMADAVGTQTEALVIRGLSVGVPIARVFRLESLTGLLVGLVLAGASLPAVWWVLGSPELAVTVALALLAACTVATVVAMALPWLVARMGRDPAFGSGPLATVIQDLLSLVIYFAVAAVVIG